MVGLVQFQKVPKFEIQVAVYAQHHPALTVDRRNRATATAPATMI
jgi:hypothetical protein